MASASNNTSPPASSSSSSAGFATPPSSSNGSGSHASAAGSNYSAYGNQPQQPSYQFLAYYAQTPTEDGSPYGRLVNQPPPPDVHARIAFYTARAQRTLHGFDARFQPTQQ